METRVKIFLLCIIASNSVKAFPDDENDSRLDGVIANHPIIKRLLMRVEFLEEKDKINTEIISDLKIRLERCEEGQYDPEIVVNGSIGEKTNGSSNNGHETARMQWPVKQRGRIETKKITQRTAKRSRDGNNRIRAVNAGETVAFFARSTTHDLHIGTNQNIIFEEVPTNIGTAFNSHHGIFIAPISGTYVFTTTILANNDAEVRVHFAVNGASMANTYARGTDGRFDSGSQTIIVTLNQGDDVSIQSTYPDENIFSGSFTTFSGFLLSTQVVQPVG